jgi:hypothetical protein
MNKIKIIHIDSLKKTISIVDVENEIKPLQKLVGGYLEVAPVRWQPDFQPIDLLVDEEGLLKSKDYGFSYEGTTFVGNAVVIGFTKNGAWDNVAKTKAQYVAILSHFKERITFL